jgi:nicotinamidase-related amidase
MNAPTQRLRTVLLALALTLSFGFTAHTMKSETSPAGGHSAAVEGDSAAPSLPTPRAPGAALLLIEFQREWLDEDEGKLYHMMEDREQFEASQQGARVALQAARESEMPVIHAPALFEVGYPEIGGQGTAGLFKAIPNAGTWTDAGRPFADGFEPEEGEFVVGGRIGASAFAHSNLDAYLRNNGITDVYLAGYALHVCVESTLREGHDLGYTMHVIEDATSAFTAKQREHVLDEVVHHYGLHLTTDEFVEGLSERAP